MKDTKFLFESLITSKDKVTNKVKWKLPKFILGTYKIDKINKNNKKLDWKILNLFGIFLIVTFLVTMIFGIGFFSYIGYKNIIEDGLIGKTASAGLLIPSFSKDSIKEVNTEIIEYNDGTRDLDDIKKRNLIFMPLLFFIPIILISTFVHEFGHYIMCRNYGLIVTSYGLGAISIFYIPVIFFAYVEPKEEDFKKIELTPHLAIASAGIVMNLILSVICFGILLIFYNYFTYLLFLINVSLAFTNVLPVIPLDGGLVIKRLAPKISTPLMIFILIIFVTLIFL